VKLEGTVGYTVLDGMVQLRINKVQNHSSSGISGTLRVLLIKAAYNFQGELYLSNYDLIAQQQLPQLPGGCAFMNLSFCAAK
jgi:hypothetical protein